MNFGLIPLVAWGLSRFQRVEDFRFGLMVAASVPSTLAAAAVITRKAGGNDAVSLLITLATNLTCFLLTPLWLKLTTGAEIPIKTFDLMVNLLLTVLLPTLVGQGLRLAGQSFAALRPLHEFATYRKQQIGIAAQMLIVAVVFTAALRAGVALHTYGSERVPLLAVALVWGSCVLAHLAAIFSGLGTARALGLPTDVADAVGFAGSQKTLPIGVYISSLAVFQDYPFVMLPILLFHASQLFLDTVIASHLAERAKPAAPSVSV
jgi:sodium/bile acid cotransporter 7